MPYSPSQILIDQVTEYLTEQLGRAPTAAEILNGLVAPWVLGNIHNVLQVPSTFINVAMGGNIQQALDQVADSGGGTVLLENGTHTLTADLEIPSRVTLEGTSRNAVLINCAGFSVKLEGTDVYDTGTIAVNDTSTSVVGTGTTWTEDMEGQNILLGESYYEIATVVDQTNLTLTFAYSGDNLSGASYAIATLNDNSALQEVTVYGATGAGVSVKYANEPKLADIIVYSCATGIDMFGVVAPLFTVSSYENGANLYMEKVYSFEVTFCAFNSALTGHGVEMVDCGNATFFDTASSGNAANGLSLTNCHDIGFVSNSFAFNTTCGVELISGNSDIQFSASTAEGNTTDGYKLTATDDRISIINTSIINNGAYGVNIAAATCDNNTILGCFFTGNSTAAATDSGTATLIRSNQGLADSP